ncbi:MAG: hypothetical protein ChlgKO_00790 [Chlamydiales bacterium]
METLIASSLIDLLDFRATSDPWKSALGFLIKEQQINPYKMESLIAPLKASSPSKEELLTAAAFLSLNEKLKYELKGDIIAHCEGVDETLRALILTLLGHNSYIELEQAKTGPESLLYFGLIALLENSHEKKRTFLKGVGELNLLLDRKGNPFFSLLTDEKHFCLATLLTVFYLLFSLAGHFSSQKDFDQIANHLHHRLGLLEGFYLDAIPSHLLILSLLIEMHHDPEKCSFAIPFAKGFYRDRAIFHEQLTKIDFTLQFAGEGNSFGALSKGNIEIVAMGPQQLPLGVMENFGIFREAANGAGEFADIIHEEKQLSGWLKLCNYGTALPEPGNEWLHVDLKTKTDYLTLTIRPKKERADLYFAFFIKAKEAKVEGQQALKPRSLDRIRGEIQEIFFKDADEFLSLRTPDLVQIEVIPLAGGNHFFSANFLVAFPIQKSLTLEMS